MLKMLLGLRAIIKEEEEDILPGSWEWERENFNPFCTVKKVSDFPVPSLHVTNHTLTY